MSLSGVYFSYKFPASIRVPFNTFGSIFTEIRFMPAEFYTLGRRHQMAKLFNFFEGGPIFGAPCTYILYIHVYTCKQIRTIAVYLVTAATTGYQTNSSSKRVISIYIIPHSYLPFDYIH